MIRLTERYYDTHSHGYRGRPLFLSKKNIAVIATSDAYKEGYSEVVTDLGVSFIVLESPETIAKMCEEQE